MYPVGYFPRPSGAGGGGGSLPTWFPTETEWLEITSELDLVGDMARINRSDIALIVNELDTINNRLDALGSGVEIYFGNQQPMRSVRNALHVYCVTSNPAGVTLAWQGGAWNGTRTGYETTITLEPFDGILYLLNASPSLPLQIRWSYGPNDLGVWFPGPDASTWTNGYNLYTPIPPNTLCALRVYPEATSPVTVNGFRVACVNAVYTTLNKT